MFQKMASQKIIRFERNGEVSQIVSKAGCKAELLGCKIKETALNCGSGSVPASRFTELLHS